MNIKLPTSIDDIDFLPHAVMPGSSRAYVTFANGYGASIITGEYFYTSHDCPYELAVFHDDSINYTHGIEDNTDVFGYCDEARVLHMLKLISELPAKTPDHG
jgi:hypothetical protein